jgi:hypothetical protein
MDRLVRADLTGQRQLPLVDVHGDDLRGADRAEDLHRHVPEPADPDHRDR